jgi:hypothetical protein
MARKSKLYFSWKALRQNNKGRVDSKWDDYLVFEKDVGEKPERHYLAKKDLSQPWGPNNFYWKKVRLDESFDHNDPQQVREYNKRYREVRPDYDREVRYKRKYGISLAIYDEMLRIQEGRCAVCGNPETQAQQGVVRQLAVDHDHKTGVVRQLLDNKCNAILGHADDSIDLLCKLIVYLARHSARKDPYMVLEDAKRQLLAAQSDFI